jgi:hypothetical protein
MAKWVKGQSGNPEGRKSKALARSDGWMNIVTGLGHVPDKRSGASFLADILDDASAQNYWIGNDAAARIIELVPREMLRAGWDLRIQGDEEDDAEKTRQA